MQNWATSIQNRRWLRLASRGIGTLLLLGILGNVVLAGLYFHKTYPNTQVAGQQLGSVSYGEVPQRLDKLALLPATVRLNYEHKQTTLSPAALGVTLDSVALPSAVKHHAYWLPFFNLIKQHQVPLTLRVNASSLDKQFDVLTAAYTRPAANARIATGKDGFSLISAKPGQTIDTTRSQQLILTALRQGQNSVTLVSKTIAPKVSDHDLAATFKKLSTQQTTAVSYTYADKKIVATPGDIASWYSQTTSTYALSDDAIKAYLTVLATQDSIKIKNISQAVTATRQAVEQTKPLHFVLEAIPYVPPSKTFTYCTALRGVDASFAPQLESKLATTYADDRGWGLSGTISFVHVGSNCDFTVYLSAASQMPTFGAICDTYWNCTVPHTVVINFDRWQSASDTWNAAGNNIEDYRSMAINHETGHWLGFNHKLCGGPGQPAPVMQQQSVDLQGCVFNPWPLPSEQAELRDRLQL